jgi:hypothetical protein
MSVLGRIVPLLRAGLVVLFGLLLVLQFFSFPGQFAYRAAQSPDQAWLRWPLTAFAAIEILCLQVILVCTWRLLGMIRSDRIFTEAALRWVGVIIAAFAAGWLLAASGALWAVWGADDPGTPVLLFTVLSFGAAFGLVIVVMRELLRRATTLQTELASVI